MSTEEPNKRDRILKELLEMYQWKNEKGVRVRDLESDHRRADDLLLEFIADEEITSAFNNIEKWYA
jgi:hypothetical protein